MPKNSCSRSIRAQENSKTLRNSTRDPSNHPPEHGAGINSYRIGPTSPNFPTISAHKPPTLTAAPPTPAHQTRTRSTRQLTSMVTSQSTLPRPPRGGAPASMYVAAAAPRRSHSRARRRPPSHRHPRTLVTAAPPSLHAGAKDGPTEPRANSRRRGWLAHRARAQPTPRRRLGGTLATRVWCRRGEQRDAQSWGEGGDAGKGRCGSGGGFSREGSTGTGAQQRAGQLGKAKSSQPAPDEPPANRSRPRNKAITYVGGVWLPVALYRNSIDMLQFLLTLFSLRCTLYYRNFFCPVVSPHHA
jgi:hypothetical protein